MNKQTTFTGKDLFVDMELVRNQSTKKPVEERVVMQIAAHCQNASNVLIAQTNRSFREYNNTVALIATKDDALDKAFTTVTG